MKGGDCHPNSVARKGYLEDGKISSKGISFQNRLRAL